MRVPIVIDDGCLPETPVPYAQAKTSCEVTSSGALPARPKKWWSMRE